MVGVLRVVNAQLHKALEFEGHFLEHVFPFHSKFSKVQPMEQFLLFQDELSLGIEHLEGV